MGLYSGNPQAHVAALQMCVGALLGVMPALYTNSGSIDCYPRFLVDAYLYGNIGHVPVRPAAARRSTARQSAWKPSALPPRESIGPSLEPSSTAPLLP
jgi:hypothetical protein